MSDTRAISPRDARHLVVLVEDDPGDTVLFEVALDDADAELALTCVPDLDALQPLLDSGSATCVVLDLGLPGMAGFDALDRIVEAAPTIAIVVLTGWGEAGAGTEAMLRGAQDYLVKGEADGFTVARSIRFAIERKRSQVTAAALAVARQQAVEQHRLERALLVDPQVHRDDVQWTSRYIAARSGFVSGDFFDGVELADGTLRFIIGDVAGHGADEAALGVSLRAGWRALVLAKLDPAVVLNDLEELLMAERQRGDEFATVCDLTISADLRSMWVRCAGHPPPVLAGVGSLDDPCGRSPLGIRFGDTSMAGTHHHLPESWSLAVYTDGLFEIRGEEGTILAVEEVPAAVEAATVDGIIHIDRLIDGFSTRASDGWRDDVAVVVVSRP